MAASLPHPLALPPLALEHFIYFFVRASPLCGGSRLRIARRMLESSEGAVCRQSVLLRVARFIHTRYLALCVVCGLL